MYGWKLHIVCTVAGVWIPLSAYLTPANEDDGKVAPKLLRMLPNDTRFVLGDSHYNVDDVRQLCVYPWRILIASGGRKYPHTDIGVEVRRIFHKLRHCAIENFNEQFKGIFDIHGQVPTKGLGFFGNKFKQIHDKSAFRFHEFTNSSKNLNACQNWICSDSFHIGSQRTGIGKYSSLCIRSHICLSDSIALSFSKQHELT